MSTSIARSPETESPSEAPSGDLVSSATVSFASLSSELTSPATNEIPFTLGSLHTGARLVLRCRKDWRGATVSSVALDCVTLSVYAPSGRTYRVRRPPDSPLKLDGSIPVLGEVTSAGWRVGLARYDGRW